MQLSCAGAKCLHVCGRSACYYCSGHLVVRRVYSSVRLCSLRWHGSLVPSQSPPGCSNQCSAWTSSCLPAEVTICSLHINKCMRTYGTYTSCSCSQPERHETPGTPLNTLKLRLPARQILACRGFNLQMSAGPPEVSIYFQFRPMCTRTLEVKVPSCKPTSRATDALDFNQVGDCTSPGQGRHEHV